MREKNANQLTGKTKANETKTKQYVIDLNVEQAVKNLMIKRTRILDRTAIGLCLLSSHAMHTETSRAIVYDSERAAL